MPPLLTVLALASTLGLTPPASTAATDVLGRPVPAGRTELVFYVNRNTRSQLHDAAVPFTYDLRGANPVIVIHVDLSDVPGLFQGMARGEMRRSYKECLADMAKLFRDHGETPPDSLADSFYMVADRDGGPHRAIGLAKRFREPFARVLGPAGEELARGPFPASAATLGHALEAQSPAKEALR